MADTRNENETESIKLKCYAHLSHVFDDVKPITETSWRKFLESVQIWKDLSGNSAEIAKAFVADHDDDGSDMLPGGSGIAMPKDGGFHRKCYQYFTDSTKQKRAVRAKQKQEANPQALSAADINASAQIQEGASDTEPAEKKPRILRSESALGKKGASRSAHVLPRMCIICRRARYSTNHEGRRSKQPLVQCELIDGGKLLEAAKVKRDETLLLHMENRDCVAIELKYHASCHKDYTRFLSKPQGVTVNVPSALYSTAFESFCRDVIDHRVINDKEVWRMTKLKRVFDRTVRDIENEDSSSYKTWSLKQRLKETYPQLCFLKPNRRYESEFVYVDNLSFLNDCKIELDSESDTDTSTSEEEQNPSTPSKRKASKIQFSTNHLVSTLRDRFSTALDIKREIELMSSDKLPWPPTSSDLTLYTAQQIIPPKLFNFLAWVAGCSDVPKEDEFVEVGEGETRRILTLAQDVIYLATKGRRAMPKHMSLAMAVRHMTGSAQLIGLLNGLGHCVSHTSVLEHDTALAQQEIQRGSNALPSCLVKGTFTTLVWDNNDFGEETLSGKGTTHNTNGIAIQHSEPQTFTTDVKQSMARTRKRSLPAPDVDLVTFRGAKKASPTSFAFGVALEEEYHMSLMEHPMRKDAAYYLTKIPQKRLLPAWTGFNQLLNKELPPKATVAYLPVIDASPTDLNTVNTILHKSVEIANKLELPSVVVVVDQAIYAKAQTIRWQTPHFMDRIVIRLGAFHTTMTALATIGKRFCDAGLQDILIESDVVAPGSMNGVINGHHYNRSIRCHKVMAEALHRLRWQSFIEGVSEVDAEQYGDMVHNLHSTFPDQEYEDLVESPTFQGMMMAYDDFIKSQSKDATFAFWSSYLEMVENVLLFVKATRDGDWALHLAAVRALVPWMFSYDRTNYSRYLPVYWLEMKSLEKTHPFVLNEFQIGNFAVQRQDVHGFSRVACDMTIEQTANRDSKTRGGMKGFTTNKGASNRWIRAHHERAAITRQCEEMAGKGQKMATRKDLTKRRMTRDEQDVQTIMTTISTMINPFDNDPETDPTELIHLSSGVIASPEVCTDLMKAHEKGNAAFVTYCKDRLQGGETDLNKPLKRMKLKTFTNMAKTVATKVKGKDVSTKSDRELLARLVIVGRSRNIDLKHMMSYCLGPLPLSLATHEGCLVKTNKAKLLHYLESAPKETPVVSETPGCVWIIDGLAMLQKMSPKHMPVTMGDLASKMLSQLVNLACNHQSNSIHFVTDRYPDISVKNAERKRRAATGSQKIKISKPSQPVPKQWKKYLANGFNKEQLVEFLFNTWRNCDVKSLKGVTLTVAHGMLCHAISANNGNVDVEEVTELHCSHEEADTRMFLHASYIAKSCNSDIVIKSPDTDVFVIGIALSSNHISSNLYFRTGKEENVRTIDLQAIRRHLGDPLSEALIGFHCFSGCDSVSAFYGKGKMKAIKLLVENPTLCAQFQLLGESFMVTDDQVTALEMFVCKLYAQHSYSRVNEARCAMFSMATKAENVMPPNRDALRKHIERANFQAAIYKRSLAQHPDIPSPVGHGWKMVDDTLGIDWMDMESAQQSVLELTKCACSKSKCKVSEADDKCCVSLGIPCTELCTCKKCENLTYSFDNEDIEESEGEDDDGENGDDEIEENFETEMERPVHATEPFS
ncbi:uncharacterized protein LOC119734467 [Patiria miniata]|uniref:Tesmin/TSO1-like CXC domain-containing protein n=1 Tax=Patiria miniata TaxID=46514 RepID=A0A914AK30_PATMI|nr:uncharacterized protein LOC119734467 [Patiria miniata]